MISTEVPGDHPVRKEWIDFFKGRLCDSVDRGIECCGNDAVTFYATTINKKSIIPEVFK